MRELERQRQAAEKFDFLTRPVRAATSPSHPEAAKTASLPRDAHYPMRRYRIAQIRDVFAYKIFPQPAGPREAASFLRCLDE